MEAGRSDDIALKMAEEFAKTARTMAAKANLKRAANATQARYVSNERAQVITPRTLAPNAFVFQNGLRHPLNYPNQVHAKHARAYMRWMARTPKRPYMTRTANDNATIERALEVGANETIKNHWDGGDW